MGQKRKKYLKCCIYTHFTTYYHDKHAAIEKPSSVYQHILTFLSVADLPLNGPLAVNSTLLDIWAGHTGGEWIDTNP